MRKNKKDLWIVAAALVSVIFIAVLYFAARDAKPVEESTVFSPEPETKSEDTDTATIFFAELPEGYAFSETPAANPERGNRMQIEILDETDTCTNAAIVLNGETEESGSGQMVLTLREDCSADDADVLLKWYLDTFLEGFTEEKKKTVYDAYLYMFDTGSQDYLVYSEENTTVMMSFEAEETGNYYYVMVSAK